MSSEIFADQHCKENDLLVVPGSMFSDKMISWVRVAWSIEPKLFKLAIQALDKSLESALN
jgi:aspartate/methionine/tyrosine aminotransferase